MRTVATRRDAGTHTAQGRAIVRGTSEVRAARGDQTSTALDAILSLKPVPVDGTLEEGVTGCDVPTLSKVVLGLVECLAEQLFSRFLHAYSIPWNKENASLF